MAIVDTAPLRAATSCPTSRLVDAREAISSSFAVILSIVVKSHLPPFGLSLLAVHLLPYLVFYHFTAHILCCAFYRIATAWVQKLTSPAPFARRS